MAALPYMQLYVADYLADTAHLTAAQHGAYLLLIFNYWQRGHSLNNANERLANVARMTNEEWLNAKPVLEEFFVIDGDEWKHERIERDLEAVNSKSSKASAAGKASAASKANGRSTDVKQTLNHIDVDTDTDTDTKAESKTIRAPRFDAPAHLLDRGVPLDLSADWIKLRKTKKAEVTKTAIAGIESEALKAGVSLEDALRECCSRGWAGFKAEWMQASQQARASPKMSHSDASKLSAARAIFGTEIEGQNGNGRIIEASAAFTGSVDRQDFPRVAR